MARSLVGEYLTEKKEERKAAARTVRKARPRRHVVSLAIIAVCAAAGIWPSLRPKAPAAMPAEKLDGGARLTLFFASLRIKEFQRSHGRLPASLDEATVTDSRISYTRTGPSTFFLRLQHAKGTWELSSIQADTTYLRDALTRLTPAPK